MQLTKLHLEEWNETHNFCSVMYSTLIKFFFSEAMTLVLEESLWWQEESVEYNGEKGLYFVVFGGESLWRLL